jgi:hypothetical protein
MTPETSETVITDPNEPMLALMAPDHVSDWVFFVAKAGELSDDVGGGHCVSGAELRAYHLRCSPTTSCAWYEPFCERVDPRYPIEDALSVLSRLHGLDYAITSTGKLYLRGERLVIDHCVFR